MRLGQVDDFPKLTWLVSYGDKRLEPGGPLTLSVALFLPQGQWNNNCYEPESTAVFPFYFLPFYQFSFLFEQLHSKGVGRDFCIRECSKYWPFCNFSWYITNPQDSFLQPLPHEQLAVTFYGGSGFGKSELSTEFLVMLCLLGTCLVCGPQCLLRLQLQSTAAPPPPFFTVAPFESQGANCFFVLVLYPSLLAIDKNCNKFGLSSALLSQ